MNPSNKINEINEKPDFDFNDFLVKKCQWHLNMTEEEKKADPHTHQEFEKPKKIYHNVLEAMINSPMIRLNKIPKSENINCEILAKCDFLLPGGSIKDRIGKRMISDAEKKGLIKENSTIIEATSGNTGIGLGIVGAIKNYNVAITMTDKISREKSEILEALGAKVYRTPNDAKYYESHSHIGLAKRLNRKIENSFFTQQYSNENNALAHYDQTAEEILDQCDGKVDYVVIATGTGGTLTGIGRKLKEKIPNVKIIGVDPEGSLVAPHEEDAKFQEFQVEGIGYAFLPRNCSQNDIVDKWLKSNDKNTFHYARRLIREEGLLVGGSSGAVLWGALEIAKKLNLDSNTRIVCVFADSVRNYITKFLNDDWLLERGFLDQTVYDQKYFAEPNQFYGGESKIAELNLKEVKPFYIDCSVKQALKEFQIQRSDYLPVLNKEGKLEGVITKKNTVNFLTQYMIKLNDEIKRIIVNDFRKLNINDPIKYLSRSLIRWSHVLVEDNKLNRFYLGQPDDLLESYLEKEDKMESQ